MNRTYGIIRVFVRHPNAANLLMVLMLICGIFAAGQLNRQVMPTVGLEAVNVAIVWPGASAEDIETNILETIEPEIRFIDGVKELNGYASEGFGGFWILFHEGTNMARAFPDVQNGIRRVEDRLPQDMERPTVVQFEMQETVSRIALSGPFSESALKAYARDIRDDLIALGVDKVNFEAVRDSEIRVNVEPSILRQLDLTIANIAQIIRDTSTDVPSGTIEGGYEMQIRSLGLKKTVQTVEDIEIVSAESGDKLRLKDIAKVEESFDRQQPEGYFDGNRSVSMTIMRAKDTDALDVAEIIETFIAEKRPTLPPSLQMTHYNIRSNFVRDRINLLAKNGLGGLVLVLGFLFLFLNGRIAFWVAAGIPIALLSAFAAMLLLGQSFNMMSLMALILTLGIIVDDAIVVGEHSATRRESGMPAVDAAESGAMRMFPPVMASSLTTIAAFLPVLMISDIMGQFVRPLPVVVIAVIAASLIECFLILPGHLRGALEHSKAKTSGFRARFNQWFNHFRDTRFVEFVEKRYDNRYVTLAGALAALIIGFGLVAGGRVPFHFFPQAEPETLMGNIIMSPGTPRGDTQAMLDELNRALGAAEDALTEKQGGVVVSSFGTIGRSKKREAWMEMAGDNQAGLWVELVAGDRRDVRNEALIAAWKANLQRLPGLERVTIQEMRGGPPGRELDVRLWGADITTLKQAALEVRELVSRFPGVRDVDDDLPYGKQQVILSLTPHGRAMGFTTESVSRQVRNAAEGAIAKRFPRDDEEVLIRVRYPEGSFTAQTFRELYLRNPQGRQVPLSEVVKIETRAGFARVRRYNGNTEVAITADINFVEGNTSLIVEALPAAGLDDIARRHGVKYTFRGKAEEQSRTMGEMRTGAIMGLAAIYIILAWVLGSYSRPIVVMSVIPFGIVGAIFGHWLLGYAFSIMSMIGLLGLSGILVNDSIILVTTIGERNDHGEDWKTAVLHGTRDRLRAVTLTSLTTVGGLLPLLFETNLQAQFLIPIAISIVFGIAFSTLIVLVVVPALLGILDDAKRAMAGRSSLRLPKLSSAPE